MLSDLLDIIFQALGSTPISADPSPGPPIDLGTGLVLMGAAATVGGIITFFVSHHHPVLSSSTSALGIMSTIIGIRLAGRR